MGEARHEPGDLITRLVPILVVPACPRRSSASSAPDMSSAPRTCTIRPNWLPRRAVGAGAHGAASPGPGQAAAVCRSAAARAAGRESMGQWPVGSSR